jgi:hypothetical protein
MYIIFHTRCFVIIMMVTLASIGLAGAKKIPSMLKDFHGPKASTWE